MGSISPLLAVRDIKETVYFYREYLGFTTGFIFPDAENPEYVDMTREEITLMFVTTSSLNIGKKERLGTGVNLYLDISDNIDDFYAELKRKRVTVVTEITDRPWGTRDFTIEDNNGYRLTFSRNASAGRICMSCGLPMTTEDIIKNPDAIYCHRCTNPDGSLKSYDETFATMVTFMVLSESMSKDVAEETVRKKMSEMPPWHNTPLVYT